MNLIKYLDLIYSSEEVRMHNCRTVLDWKQKLKRDFSDNGETQLWTGY